MDSFNEICAWNRRETSGDLRVLKGLEFNPAARPVLPSHDPAPTEAAVAVEDDDRLAFLHCSTFALFGDPVQL
jgi:hypothetical protein